MPITLRSLTRKPKPPKAPTADPRYVRVMQQLGQKAAKVKAHPTPAKKAGEAAKAAKGPPNEKAAGAKGKQVDKIKDAKTKKPEPDSFLSLLRAEIEKAMPKTLDDTSKFMKGGDAAALKGGLKGNVAQQKQAATGDTAQSTKQQPSTAGVPGKESQAIPDEAAPPRPDVPAGDAMPAPKSDADVSVQDSKQDTEAAMADAEVTEDQCKKANDSRFSAVLESKGQVAKQADAAPGQYRSAEKGVLTNAAAGARGMARTGAAAMMGVKGRSKSNVLTRQQAAKAKDEAERKQVADTIEAIYTKTKTAVESKLAALDDEVNAIFDSGTDAALAAMKAYTEARIDAYKDDRYSGVLGKGRWIRDQFKGLPEAANRFYVEGRNLFARLMDAVIVRVANLVEQRLREAKALVAAGQAEIKKYVDSLPKNLKSVGQAAQKEVGDRFKELERGIEDKKGQLASQLAQKYKEAFDKADKALKEIQDSNKGLVQKFVEKLGEIIKIIREFKGKLMAALRKGWAVIKGILADPIGFLGNLIAALKQGFNQFKANIETWLIKGLIGWLFGALAEAGVTPPADFSLPSILKLVLQILGITYERMREKAVKLLGPTAVGVIEKLVEYVKTLVTGGPAALWAQVSGDLADLKERVLGDIRTMIITEVIKAAVLKIVSMFNPAGAFIQAVLAIYNTVMFVIEQASRIAALVSSVIDSVSAIAGGAIGAAAKRIEEAMGAAIPIVIGFLARLVGVGGLPKKATAVVKKVQTAIDKAIDKLLAKAVKFVKGFFSKLKGTGKQDERTPAQKEGELRQALSEAEAILADKNLTAKQVGKKLPAIQKKYRLVSLKVVVASQTGEEETDYIEGEINPRGKSKSHKKAKPPTPQDLADAEAKAVAKKWTKGVEYDEIKVATSGSGNERIYAFKGGERIAHYVVANKAWNPIRSIQDKEEIKKAEADLLALLKAEMPGWVSTFDEGKSSDAPGSDAAGIGQVAPRPPGPEDTRAVPGEEGETRAVVGEAKYSGAKGRGRYFQLKDFSSITRVLERRIDEDMQKQAAAKGKAAEFKSAVKSGNITVVIYLAGKAQVSGATIAKLKTSIKIRLRNYIKSKYPKVKIEDVAGNIDVQVVRAK